MTDPVGSDQQQPQPSPISTILQRGIEQMQANQAQANEELFKLLADHRDRVAQGYVMPGPTVPVPDEIAADPRYKEQLLWHSRWASEMIAAAALDDDFKNAVEKQAQDILRANGRLPETPPA